MKRKGLEIINADVNQIIDQLNKALSDEWLAYYQYWLGEKLVKGKFREEDAAELGQHVLQFDVNIERAVEKTRAGATAPVAAHGLHGRFFHARIVGQAHVGV